MPLREAQVDISGWVRAPQGVAVALAEGDAKPDGVSTEGASHRLEDLIRSDESLDAIGRLEIYANAYFCRILDVLRTDYPALLALMGDAAFNDLVTSYLLVEPSQSPSLRYAGLRLSDFICTHEAAVGIRARWPWASDLAAFEWARIDAFDAADGLLLTRETVASIEPTDFGRLFLCLGPWVFLRSFEYPVAELWKAGIHEKGHLGEEMTGQSRMLVWRRDEKVLHRSLDPDEEAALALLSIGSRFDALCEWAAGEIGTDEAPARAARWLEQWLSDGVLMASIVGSGAGVSDE